MTAAEKAEELYSQMYRILFHTNADPIHCKQCALIAVDEILNLCWGGNKVGMKHWNEVKQEIEKL